MFMYSESPLALTPITGIPVAIAFIRLRLCVSAVLVIVNTSAALYKRARSLTETVPRKATQSSTCNSFANLFNDCSCCPWPVITNDIFGMYSLTTAIARIMTSTCFSTASLPVYKTIKPDRLSSSLIRVRSSGDRAGVNVLRSMGFDITLQGCLNPLVFISARIPLEGALTNVQ